MAIEKLSVILELVTGNYNREAKQAANATGQIGNSAKSVTGQLGAMIGPAAIGGAILGLGKMALAAGENADRLFDLAAQTGLSTDALQEWEFVAKAAGAGTEVFSDAVKAVIRNLNETEGATGAAAKAYDTLGISTLDATGKLRDAGAITDEVFTKLASMENITARNALAQDIFGKKWEETISILDLGGDAIGKLRGEAHDLGAVISGESLEGADKFRESFEKLKTVLTGKLMEALGDLGPVLSDITDVIIDMVEELDPLLEGLGFLSEQFSNLKEQGTEMAVSDNVVVAGWGRMIENLGILNVLTGNYTGTIEGAISATETSTNVTRTWAGGLADAARATRDLTVATDDLTSAYAAADDAELSMLRSEEKVIEARLNLIKVTDDATSSTHEKRVAQLEYNIAVATARELTDEYKASLDALNGTRANVTVITTMQQRAAKERIEESQYRASGGSVNAGRSYIVGERGAELFVPQQSGSIVPNRMLGGAGNQTTIVVQSPMNDFRSDMQYATILASVTNLVEGF